MSARRVVAQALYCALFLLAVPALLVFWARRTAPYVSLEPVHAPAAGLALGVLGVLLMVSGGWGLIVHGRGLPMNAFPPERLVARGVFRWIRNPMYIGSGLLAAGVSIATGSASGLWLVTPTLALAAASLVYGFERHDLRRRFGPDALRPPGFSWPGKTQDVPAPAQRVAVYLWVLLPWLLAYFSLQALGRAPDAFGTSLGFERKWPVWQWTELFYFTTYLFIPLTPLLIRTQRDLRDFARRGVVATVTVTLLWLTVPVVATNRPFIPAHFLGRLLAFEQGASRRFQHSMSCGPCSPPRPGAPTPA